MSCGSDTGPDERGAPATRRGTPLPHLTITFTVAAAALCGVYAVSRWAAWAGLPVSRELVFEGRWYVASWRHLPWVDMGAMLALMVALPWAVVLAQGGESRRLGLSLHPRALAWAAAGVALAALAYVARHGLTAPPPGLARVGSRTALAAYLLVVALAEEVTFRGFLQRRLAESTHFWIGLVAASALFAAWHGPSAPVELWAFRFAAGVLLGVLYRCGRSLLAPVLCHWLVSLALAV